MTLTHAAKGAALSFGFTLMLVRSLVAVGAAQQPAPCCFDREGYPGVCTVQPAPGESCESILQYLNSPNTMGKTYCGGSRFRGGWTLVDCARGRPQRGGR